MQAPQERFGTFDDRLIGWNRLRKGCKVQVNVKHMARGCQDIGFSASRPLAKATAYHDQYVNAIRCIEARFVAPRYAENAQG